MVQKSRGGVVVSYWDSSKTFEPIKIFTPFSELNSILKKTGRFSETESLMSIIFAQNRFDLEKLYEEYPEFRSIIGSDGRDKRFRNNIFEKINLFADIRTHESDIEIIGVIKNKRCRKYIPCRFLDLKHENLNYWKVLVPASNGSGALGEIISTPLIGTPLIGYTQTFIGIGEFETESEAQAALKYVKSKFARTMLGVLKVTQDNKKETWRFVPLQDFTSSSDIDWSVSVREVDRQLYAKYGLTQEEIDFIETHVKEME